MKLYKKVSKTCQNNFSTFFPKGKKAVDWASPTTMITVILSIILGLAFLYYIWTLKGKLGP
jgi:hypothetical protein